jgi:protein involved in polysaccharide export with SLBB domain
MTLGDLIIKADGLREYAYLDRADLIRTEDDFSKSLMVIRLSDFYKRDGRGKFALIAESKTNPVLQPMDEVLIQSVFGMAGNDPHVTMEGHVKEPGRYVLARNMMLYDLVFARGGFQDESFRKATYLNTAHIFRKASGDLGKQIISFNLDALLKNDPNANMPIQDGDVIRIYSADEMRTEQKVSIGGLVKQPGNFPMAEGMTLEDLIVMAGGILPDAFKVEATIARSERDDKGGVATSSDPVSTLHIPVDIKHYMNLALDQRTHLMPDDRVTLRAMEGEERTASVQVDGEALEPGHYSLLQKNELLSSLIRRAGGLKETALPEGATILRRKTGPRSLDGDKTEEVYRVPVNVRAALNEPGGADDIVVLRDDRIYIPANPGVVEVRGAVRRELTLKHKSGRSVAEYIDLCGGYLDKADPANVRVFSANQTALSLKPTTKSRSGRATASVQDIPPGSIIEVPFIRATERLQTVEVKGAVNKPISLQYIEGAPLGYYLNLSGGFSADADLDNISVLLPDGGLLVKTGNQPFNPVIPGGSQIMVTRKNLAPAQ